MLRSRSVHQIRDLFQHGYSVRAIAEQTGMSRNTVRKYLRTTPEVAPRPRRRSKLDPFKDQVRRWMTDDHLFNCETMFERLQELGYTGGRSLIKAFVQPLRPPRLRPLRVQRYETLPGEQLQCDWGEFLVERDGSLRKLYGFTAILSYSRMRFVCFSPRCTVTTLIRSLLAACQYFGGLPQTVLTDRMKSVLLHMDGRHPIWHTQFAECLSALGMTPRVCRAYAPQTKGKVERTIGVVKQSFWPGITFTDLTDLNRQAQAWCDGRNQRVHATTHVAPITRWMHEGLRPLPSRFVWERFTLEDRRVSVDGFLSFEGQLYGVPATVLGTVQVGVQERVLVIWQHGQEVARHRLVHATPPLLHPQQFQHVPPASTRPVHPTPTGHWHPADVAIRRALSEYDQMTGVTSGGGA